MTSEDLPQNVWLKGSTVPIFKLLDKHWIALKSDNKRVWHLVIIHKHEKIISSLWYYEPMTYCFRDPFNPTQNELTMISLETGVSVSDISDVGDIYRMMINGN